VPPKGKSKDATGETELPMEYVCASADGAAPEDTDGLSWGRGQTAGKRHVQRHLLLVCERCSSGVCEVEESVLGSSRDEGEWVAGGLDCSWWSLESGSTDEAAGEVEERWEGMATGCRVGLGRKGD
jgi:hypothetical protein